MLQDGGGKMGCDLNLLALVKGERRGCKVGVDDGVGAVEGMREVGRWVGS